MFQWCLKRDARNCVLCLRRFFHKLAELEICTFLWMKKEQPKGMYSAYDVLDIAYLHLLTSSSVSRLSSLKQGKKLMQLLPRQMDINLTRVTHSESIITMTSKSIPT